MEWMVKYIESLLDNEEVIVRFKNGVYNISRTHNLELTKINIHTVEFIRTHSKKLIENKLKHFIPEESYKVEVYITSPYMEDIKDIFESYRNTKNVLRNMNI
jgi:hypothetical protein